jgi:hypothetical protein
MPMKTITVVKPSPEQVADMKGRPTWEKEASSFDWFYDEPETALVLEGRVRVTGEDGRTVEFGPGDLVTFPAGLSCRWEVIEPVRKHYKMG